MPQVSVVTSTYNRSAMLEVSLHTALAQRDVELELVVVDNGSTDDTAQRLARIDDPRLRVIRNEESLGPTGGRNTGLAAVSGRWVAVLDDDDLWAPGKLAAQLAASEAAGRDWAYTGAVFVDGHGRVIGGRPPPPPDEVMAALPVAWPIDGGISNIVWRNGVLDEGGLLDPKLSVTGDWDIALRLARHGPPAWVCEPHVGYRQHGGNFSRFVARHLTELDYLEHKFSDLRDGRALDRGLQHRFVGSEALRVDERSEALRAYRRAWQAGDRGALVRAAGVLVPRALHPWLRRRFLSDPAWMRTAEAWLRAVGEVPAGGRGASGGEAGRADR